MGILTSTLNQPAGRTYISFLRRNADEFYWNTVTEQFEQVNLALADNATRAPFRVSYTENVGGVGAGVYSWNIDVSAFIDGSYTYASKELVGEVEYSDERVKTFKIINGVMAGSSIDAELNYTPGRNLFTFMRREEDSLYYNTTNTSFEIFDILTAPAAQRIPFRIIYVEDNAGVYTWQVDVSTFDDGVYTLLTRELDAQMESIAGADFSLTVAGGAVVEGAVLGDIGIDEDTGGPNSLSYLDPGGAPVPGASIKVFRKEDYDAGNYLVQGTTFTTDRGGWQSPVFVSTGKTYTVVFNKPGSFGPDSAEVTV